ncbi:metalloendopeptidase [Coemansia sp. RSA 552]|nr:metalloendopeptidase [Coemansia sp. RSA 552]
MTATPASAPATVLNFNLSPHEIGTIVDRLIAEGSAIYDRVAAQTAPTFDNVVVPLAQRENEHSTDYYLVTFLQNVSTDKAVRDASTAAEERLNAFEIESLMRADVYRVVHAVFDDKAAMDKLGAEDRRLVERMERDFRRNGLALDDAARARLGAIKKQLSDVAIRFGRNINEGDGQAAFTREELTGLPEDYFDGRATTVEDGVEKFIVTTRYPDLFPALKLARDETTRRRLLFVEETRCPENVALLQQAVELRLEAAHLQGFRTHAEFVLEVNMAETPAAVLAFEGDLRRRLDTLADGEMAELEALKRADKEQAGEAYTGLFSWDFRYYMNLAKERKHRISDEEVKQYFPMQPVLRGILDIYQEMLSLKFVKVTDAAVWHDDVEMYEVWEAEGGAFVGHFYLDLYPRDAKYSHAAVWPIRPGFRRADGTHEPPVAAMVANFPKPTSGAPALLKHSDAVTLLHELGHVFHGICSQTTWARFHGTNTEGDFVEAPSQMLENWGWEPAVLQRFAVHYQTGEPIPKDLVKRLVAAKNEGAGLTNLRQVFFGLYDMAIHNTADGEVDVKQTYLDLRTKIGRFQNDSAETWGVATFGHMAGGYDAQYYGYMWSEVFSADMYESRFKKDGVDNAKTGMDYRRQILQPGGSRDSMDGLVAFLGRKPTNAAFLRSIGLAADSGNC